MSFTATNESGTQLTINGGSIQEQAGMLIRITHPREGDLSFMLTECQSVILRQYIDKVCPFEAEPEMYSVSRLRKMFHRDRSVIVNIIKLEGMLPAKIENSIKLYDSEQMETIRAAVK